MTNTEDVQELGIITPISLQVIREGIDRAIAYARFQEEFSLNDMTHVNMLLYFLYDAMDDVSDGSFILNFEYRYSVKYQSWEEIRDNMVTPHMVVGFYNQAIRRDVSELGSIYFGSESLDSIDALAEHLFKINSTAVELENKLRSSRFVNMMLEKERLSYQ